MPDYAPGVPMWTDVSSPNLERSKAFYTALFPWEAETVPDPNAGGYTIFRLNGAQAGALRPTFPGEPAAWETFIHAPDVDATADAVQRFGGRVVDAPMDVLGQGRMAVFTDPEGAYFAAWQPQEHRGAEVVNVPYSFSWNELNVRDIGRAEAFYGDVFGWTAETAPYRNTTYTQFKVDGRAIAGMIDISNLVTADVPPHWLVYFTVEDADAIADRTQQLDGSVLVAPQDIDMGRMAIVRDPVGAVFGVMSYPQQ